MIVIGLVSPALGAQVRPPQIESEDDARRRFEYFYRQRAYPFSRIPAHPTRAQMTARWRNASLAPLNPAAAPDPVTAWTALGPAPIGASPGDAGRVTGLAVDPANSQVIYAGGAQGGVWKTTNGGSSWAPLTDTQCSTAVGSITLDPLNTNIVYVGTGEENFSGDSYYGCGVLKSVDGGVTWTTLGGSIFDTPSGGARIGKIAIIPGSGGATTSTFLLLASDFGVYRSINAGTSWTQTLGQRTTDVIADPTNPSVVYAGVWSGSSGVYKSLDSGKTFSKLAGNLPSANVGRIALGISPAAPLTVYAAIHNSATNGLLGIWKTTDAGVNWSQLTATNASCASQCWYDIAITPDPADASHVYFSGLSLYRSTDGGASFTNVGNAIHVDHHALVFDVATQNAVVAGSDGGVYRSTNNGTTWTKLNTNLAITQFYPGISMAGSGPNPLIGGTQDNGTLRYTGSLSWSSIIGGDGGFTATNPITGVSFGETQWGGSYSGPRRSDIGYSQVISGINLSDGGLFIPPLVMDQVRPTTLYFGTSKLYKTVNSGTSWTMLLANAAKGTCCVSAIGPAAGDSNTVYVGTSDGNVQVTSNGGTNWAVRITGLPNRYVTDFAVHRFNPQIAYVSFSGFSSGHVFKTLNGGGLWTNVSGNLPDIPVNAIVLLPDGELEAGTDLGVYRSSDDGATWVPFGGSGLPNVAVTDLAFNRTTNDLVAGTHGRGMFKSTVTVGNVATAVGTHRQPGGAMPNIDFVIQPTVGVLTVAGDDVLGATNPVTASIKTGTGTLSGTTTVAAVNGLATFTNLKIVGSGLFSLQFTSGALAPDTTATFKVGVLRGDVTDDGVIAASDAQAVLQSLVGLTVPPSYKPTPNGDANCSGSLQALDAQIILAKVVGKNVSAFCVGTIQ